MISLGNLQSLVGMLNKLEPTTAKTLLKLVSVDVLRSLGDGKFLININNKQTLSAKSSVPLEIGAKYLANLEQESGKTPKLSSMQKLPKLLESMKILQEQTSLVTKENLQKILSPKHLSTYKEQLLEELLKSPSKEHFVAHANLLLSLEVNVFTFAALFYEYFGFIQLKKRYNKKTKKSFLSFYAFFQSLGGIAGVISEDVVALSVAKEEIKELLEANKESFSHRVQIEVVEFVEPLFDIESDKHILDITT